MLSGVLLVAALAAACGDDGPDDGSALQTDPSEAVETGGGQIAGSVGDDDLLVPREYLQGVWCDDEGTTFEVDGDTAVMIDATGGRGELPVDVLFLASGGNELISRADDAFVISVAGDELMFVRGAC
jgi:hypothetical protein